MAVTRPSRSSWRSRWTRNASPMAARTGRLSGLRFSGRLIVTRSTSSSSWT